MEIYRVNLRIYSEYEKIKTRKKPVSGHFLRSLILIPKIKIFSQRLTNRTKFAGFSLWLTEKKVLLILAESHFTYTFTEYNTKENRIWSGLYTVV